MPLVIIKADRNHLRLTDDYLHRFGLFIREKVAETLHCDDAGGALTVNDIEVDFQDRPPRDIGGHQYHLQITVVANEFPSRKINLKGRNESLTALVKDYLPGDVHGFIWILLCPSSFQEF